jgi:hypothetical protein
MSNLILTKSSLIHIPKCAGTQLQAFLHHLNLVKYRYNYPQDGHLFLHQMMNSKDTYNFCFIRNPYTWWPSFWYWSKSGAGDRFSKQEKECPDFDTWIQDYGPFWMGLYSKLILRYIGEDSLYESDIKMNFIGKIENLYNDLFIALKNSGEIFNEGRFHHLVKEADTKESLKKWSNKQEYKKEISEQSKNIIYKSEKWIFDRFNYEV